MRQYSIEEVANKYEGMLLLIFNDKNTKKPERLNAMKAIVALHCI